MDLSLLSLPFWLNVKSSRVHREWAQAGAGGGPGWALAAPGGGVFPALAAALAGPRLGARLLQIPHISASLVNTMNPAGNEGKGCWQLGIIGQNSQVKHPCLPEPNLAVPAPALSAWAPPLPLPCWPRGEHHKTAFTLHK